jgi:hypothetical protein
VSDKHTPPLRLNHAADCYSALMTSLESAADEFARLARTPEQKTAARTFGDFVAGDARQTLEYLTAEALRPDHPAAPQLQADNARLRAALEGTLYALDRNMDGPGPSKQQAIADARAALAEDVPTLTLATAASLPTSADRAQYQQRDAADSYGR